MRLNVVYGELCGALVLLLPRTLVSEEVHSHPAPEKLGTVVFPTTCNQEVQKEFERAVALLHSFAYLRAEASFRAVAVTDPNCAIAHWGIAMTYFQQLWEPPIRAGGFNTAQQEIRRAQEMGTQSDRERRLIDALAFLYDQAVPYHGRIVNYEASMKELAEAYGTSVEAQVFYALALLAASSPLDKTHGRQKQALEILEPLYRKYPQHPGVAHYLIHSCDNGELAGRGVAAARAYSEIAPSAPHALHMPSHIFTRLGMWSDSIASNRAARVAAHEQGDIGEELHAMDYLVYAYLQQGLEREANEVLKQLTQLQHLDERDFKVAYASTAMPVRHAVERRQWAEAASIAPPYGAPPEVIAIAVWSRALGLARSGNIAEVPNEIDRLRQLEQQLGASGNEYWAKQIRIEAMEASAWLAQAEGKADDARTLLRRAADEEDTIEKLPVTPGPIIPAREQLGDLLLAQNEPNLATEEFQRALTNAPKRLGALQWALARERARDTRSGRRQVSAMTMLEDIEDAREATRRLLVDGRITLTPAAAHTAMTPPVRLKALGDHMLELAGVVRGVRGPYKVNKLCGSGGRICHVRGGRFCPAQRPREVVSSDARAGRTSPNR
jgi:tetratricopeptide (TPR) repeat protein